MTVERWLRKIVTSSDWQQPECATPGFAYASQSRTVGELVRGLMLIHQVLSTDEMNDHIEHL